ncbi:MAG TPA: DUF2971 domain-containing protein [Arsenophonus nasoniae]|uniref:DUF2971 domain-containing protein n=1 Tax=Arsenophonus nasoniae TaxID=638 RepID=UPI003879E662
MVNLYYFTSAVHAISNIENDRIKISRFSDLNDPFELLGVNRGDLHTRKKLQRQKKEINKKEGLICLSKSWRNPLMWGHYADRHKGIVLGFEVKDRLWDIKYESKLIDAPIDLTYNFAKKKFIKKLMTTKFKDWEYENEVRVFQKLSGTECLKEGENYFRNFNEDFILKEVIFGSMCSLSDMKETLKLIKKPRFSSVEITKARIAFQDYKVVVNKIKTKEINLLREQLLKESTAV